LADENPGVFFHLAIASKPNGLKNESWRVNYEWPVHLALICKKLGTNFIFTSTVMVFFDNAIGPFMVEAIPDATEEYGFEKRMAEEKILENNPEAVVARLG
jgi:dTDP-4-dehydrorhamnose reductase